MTHRGIGVPILLVALVATSVAHAQRDLGHRQSDEWYVTHGATLGTLTLANAAALVLWHPREARIDAAFRWERGAELNQAPLTRQASDVTLWTSVAAPIGTLAVQSEGAWGNALIVYAEAIEGTVLCNTLTKKTVMRARPYTHNPDARALVEENANDANVSFYSGHSALAFTAATAGSMLFSLEHDSEAARIAHWSTAFSLAGFTAHARVRAGRHYPTDVLVGSAMGVAWGFTPPLLHDLHPELRVSELIGGGAGVAAGVLAAALMPRRMGAKLAAVEPRFVPTRGGVVVSIGSLLP